MSHILAQTKLLILAIFLSFCSCGQSNDLDANDEPSVTDKLVAKISGESPYETLHSYNNLWEGEIVLRNGNQIPLSTTLLETPFDAKQASDYNISKDMYAVLEFPTFSNTVVAAHGEASHHNWTRYSEDDHAALKSREFLNLTLNLQPNAAGAETLQQQKRDDYDRETAPLVDALDAVFGHDASSEVETRTLRIVAERKHHEFIGYLVVDDGKNTTAIGDVKLHRSEKAIDAKELSTMSIDTPRFLFATEKNGNQTSFNITLK